VDHRLDGEFTQKRGELPHDLDGIYVAVQSQSGRVRITGDYAGTIPLFLYRNTGFWAVTPSLSKLFELAKARGDQLNVVQDVLQAWRISGAIGQFPRNYQTCVSEVTVVPSYCDLIGTDRSVAIVPRKRAGSRDYESAINRYRQITGGRFRTIVENDGHLMLDITGGIDSRAILATALEEFEEPEFATLNSQGRLSLRTNPRNQIDLPIARQLAEIIGLDLRFDRRGMATEGSVSDGARSGRAEKDQGKEDARIDGLLATWREERVGRWAIPGTDRRQWDQRMFSSSGVFGGNLKSPNPQETTVDDGRIFLKKFRKKFDSAELFERWSERVIEDVKEAQKWTGGDKLPFWPIFNREFVMRMHAGQSLGSHRLFPFASKDIADAVNHLDNRQLGQHRVHHDLIYVGAKSIYGAGYDKESKSPQSGFTPTVLPKIKCLGAGVFSASVATSGLSDEGVSRVPGPVFLQHIRDRTLEICERPEIREMIGESRCDEVIQAVSELPREMRGVAFYKLAKLHEPHLAELLVDLGAVPEGKSKRNGPKDASWTRGGAS